MMEGQAVKCQLARELIHMHLPVHDMRYTAILLFSCLHSSIVTAPSSFLSPPRPTHAYYPHSYRASYVVTSIRAHADAAVPFGRYPELPLGPSACHATKPAESHVKSYNCKQPDRRRQTTISWRLRSGGTATAVGPLVHM
jgi:hypothetical protein